MDANANPIEFLIEFAWANGADKFVVNNAKDELKKLKEASQLYEPVCWAKINHLGDLYDPRLCYNPFVDENTVIPLYSNKKEFKEKYDKLSK